MNKRSLFPALLIVCASFGQQTKYVPEDHRPPLFLREDWKNVSNRSGRWTGRLEVHSVIKPSQAIQTCESCLAQPTDPGFIGARVTLSFGVRQE